MQNFSFENVFDLHENDLTDETYFNNNGFAQTRFDTEAKGNSAVSLFWEELLERLVSLNKRFIYCFLLQITPREAEESP